LGAALTAYSIALTLCLGPSTLPTMNSGRLVALTHLGFAKVTNSIVARC